MKLRIHDSSFACIRRDLIGYFGFEIWVRSRFLVLLVSVRAQEFLDQAEEDEAASAWRRQPAAAPAPDCICGAEERTAAHRGGGDGRLQRCRRWLSERASLFAVCPRSVRPRRGSAHSPASEASQQPVLAASPGVFFQNCFFHKYIFDFIIYSFVPIPPGCGAASPLPPCCRAVGI